ncbi:MAG TPA: S1 RNA-binding domain-containing protein, partial [Planctomycetia bacterium]|nr:S1 RNA-binding domain-containing protein [Planctomycetia bacterium]
MKKEMLINVLQPEETRIAILEDGALEELYVERVSHESFVGNIYKGRIVNIEPSIQAAFVDFGVGRNGFLHISDVDPLYFPGKVRMEDVYCKPIGKPRRRPDRDDEEFGREDFGGDDFGPENVEIAPAPRGDFDDEPRGEFGDEPRGEGDRGGDRGERGGRRRRGRGRGRGRDRDEQRPQEFGGAVGGGGFDAPPDFGPEGEDLSFGGGIGERVEDRPRRFD